MRAEVVYEAMVDRDGTTRSRMESEGLFASLWEAEQYLSSLSLKNWQQSLVVPRPIKKAK